MEHSLFKLTKDFYTLKAEYLLNMQQIQQANQRLTSEVDRLTKSFNKLRDSFAEYLEQKHQ